MESSNENLVSVIIPTYGSGEFLCESIKSVLNQSYKDIEVIVVDDNGVSTVNQLQNAERMTMFREFKNVKYICHDKNLNGSAARNTGVRNSLGTYLAFLDDDDVYFEQNIAQQVYILSGLSDDYAMTYCSSTVYLKNVKLYDRHVHESGDLLYKLLLHEVTIGSSSLLIKRSAYEAVGGFDESFRRHQDWEFTARVAVKYKILAINIIGFRRNLEFRNSPKNFDTAKKYRLHYLDKMEPYMQRLSVKEKAKVIVVNRMDVALVAIKNKDINVFISEWKEIRPGNLGIRFMMNRALKLIKRGGLIR